MLDLTAFEVLAIPGNDAHAIGINGHRVHAGNDEVGFLDIAGPAGSTGGHGPGGVQDRQLGFDHRRQVRDGLVDIELGVEALPVPDQAHEALHSKADARGGMGLRHRNVDQHGVV